MSGSAGLWQFFCWTEEALRRKKRHRLPQFLPVLLRMELPSLQSCEAEFSFVIELFATELCRRLGGASARVNNVDWCTTLGWSDALIRLLPAR